MLDGYKIVTIPTNFIKPFQDFNKEEAKAYLEWFLNKKEERKVILSETVKDYFILDYSINSLKGVYYFVKDNVNYKIRSVEEVNRVTEEIKMKGVVVPQKDLDEKTISICFDMGVYFGEVLIRNNNNLKWDYCISPKNNVNYGQPIVKGNNKMELNPRRVFENIGYSLIDYKPISENRIIELYHIWLKSLYT
jgi:hypothetical protein